MEQEAIQSDVSAQVQDQAATTEQQTERPLSARESKMAELLAARDVEVTGNASLPGSTEDLPALYGTKDDPWDETGSKAVGEQQDDQQSAQAEQSKSSPIYERDGEQYMRIKVNGEEREVPLAQVQVTMQKHTAADLRLQQASERLREVEARERHLQQQAQQIQQQQRLPVPGVDGADSEALMADARAIIDGLYEGDTDSATEKLAQLLAGRQAPTLDPHMIQQQAEQAALRTIEQREYMSDLTKGQEQFAAEFPAIVADDRLFTMADQATIRLSQENPNWSPTKVLMEAGKQVDGWLKSQRGEGQQPAAILSSREANKQQLKPLPASQRNAAHVPPREPVVDSSPTGVIARMRGMRGQK